MGESQERTLSKPYEVLQQQLRSSEYKPGTVLTEGGLASEFGFSRTPIREALLRLEQDGLLVRTPRGMRIPDRTVDEVTNLYEVCMILEPDVAAIVARRHRPHEIIVLRDALERARVEIEAGRSPRAAFDEWHIALWESARNPVLADTLRRLSSQMATVPARAGGEKNWRTSHEQHLAITDFVESFDGEAAAEVMRAHLGAGRDAAIRVILASQQDEA